MGLDAVGDVVFEYQNNNKLWIQYNVSKTVNYSNIITIGGAYGVLYIVTNYGIYYMGSCSGGMCGRFRGLLNYDSAQFTSMNCPFAYIRSASIGY